MVLARFAERAAYLDKIADAIEKRKEEFAKIESVDSGKPVSLALCVDIPRAIANFRWQLAHALCSLLRACWTARFFAGAVRHDATECHNVRDFLF